MTVRRSRGAAPKGGRDWITNAECAIRLALSTKQIAREVEAGMPHERDGNKLKFPWPDVRIWRDEHIREMAKAEMRPADKDDARKRREAAEADLAELKLSRERGEVLPVQDFEKLLENAFTRVRARLLAIPPKLGAYGVGHKNARDAQAALEPFVYEAMAELSEAGDVSFADEDAA